MADLGFAVKEKVTPDHDVIDEAIREEAEVWLDISSRYLKLSVPGLYRLLNTRRHSLPPECSKGQELENQRLLREGETRGRFGSIKCLYWIRRLRSEEECPRWQCKRR